MNGKINNTRVRIVIGDLAMFPAEVLVSSDDNVLNMRRGVSKAIAIAAGEEFIRNEARKLTPLPISGVGITSSGDLTAKYIFHGITMAFQGGDEGIIYPDEGIIRDLVNNCLELADLLNARTIGMPAFGAGTGGLNFETCMTSMVNQIALYIRDNRNTNLRRVDVVIRKGKLPNEELTRIYDASIKVDNDPNRTRIVPEHSDDPSVEEVTATKIDAKTIRRLNDLKTKQQQLYERLDTWEEAYARTSNDNPDKMTQAEEIDRIKNELINISEEISRLQQG